MRETRKEIRRFESVADDGTEQIIVEVQISTSWRTVDGSWDPISELISFELSDGAPVDRVDMKTYKSVWTGQVLREVR